MAPPPYVLSPSDASASGFVGIALGQVSHVASAAGMEETIAHAVLAQIVRLLAGRGATARAQHVDELKLERNDLAGRVAQGAAQRVVLRRATFDGRRQIAQVGTGAHRVGRDVARLDQVLLGRGAGDRLHAGMQCLG